MAIRSKLALLPLFLAGCVSASPAEVPTEKPSVTNREAAARLFVASPASRIGGQARLEGWLRVKNGCVVVEYDGKHIVPIFDSSVAWTASRDGITDTASGERIPIGARLSGSAAYLREPNSGWDNAEIEKFIGVVVPADCGDTIVRVRSMKAAATTP